ncbi:MAG: 4-(cytidine 5'-diphospho)-2-C-methyl-D-erythritol kinase, partial [Clostridiales bacterium]|nr:4-(cytidine 5'-diphospho)-2-C-methyl-D-erythritol kinase [Clostridiales bacterium]
MKSIQLNAYAKINLGLDILGKRPDGYHEVRMIMQTIGLHDRLSMKI